MNSIHFLSFVTQSPLISFCWKLNNNYNVLGWTAISDKNIHRQNIKKLEIQTILTLCKPYLSQTTGASSSISTLSFMVIAVHFIENNWVMGHLVIFLVRMIFPHPADRLAQHVFEHCTRWNFWGGCGQSPQTGILITQKWCQTWNPD